MRVLLASAAAAMVLGGVYALAAPPAPSPVTERAAPPLSSLPALQAVLPPRAASAPGTIGCARVDLPSRAQPTRPHGDAPRRPAAADSLYEDIRGNPAYACTLREGDPPTRLVLVADPEHGQPVAVHVRGGDRDGAPVQVLPLDDAASQPFRGSAFFQGVDLNRDGWMDLKVLTTWGFSGNEAFDVFRYAPSSGRFVPDSVLTGEGMVLPVEGRPCVATHWHLGIGVYSDGEYCWTEDRWVLARAEDGDYQPLEAGESERIHLHTVRELWDGQMRIVRVDTNSARH